MCRAESRRREGTRGVITRYTHHVTDFPKEGISGVAPARFSNSCKPASLLLTTVPNVDDHVHSAADSEQCTTVRELSSRCAARRFARTTLMMRSYRPADHCRSLCSDQVHDASHVANDDGGRYSVVEEERGRIVRCRRRPARDCQFSPHVIRSACSPNARTTFRRQTRRRLTLRRRMTVSWERFWCVAFPLLCSPRIDGFARLQTELRTSPSAKPLRYLPRRETISRISRPPRTKTLRRQSPLKRLRAAWRARLRLRPPRSLTKPARHHPPLRHAHNTANHPPRDRSSRLFCVSSPKTVFRTRTRSRAPACVA